MATHLQGEGNSLLLLVTLLEGVIIRECLALSPATLSSCLTTRLSEKKLLSSGSNDSGFYFLACYGCVSVTLPWRRLLLGLLPGEVPTATNRPYKCFAHLSGQERSVPDLKVNRNEKHGSLNTYCVFLFLSDFCGQEWGQWQEELWCSRSSSGSCWAANHRHLSGQSMAISHSFWMKVPSLPGNAALVSGAQHAKLKHWLLWSLPPAGWSEWVMTSLSQVLSGNIIIIFLIYKLTSDSLRKHFTNTRY